MRMRSADLGRALPRQRSGSMARSRRARAFAYVTQWMRVPRQRSGASERLDAHALSGLWPRVSAPARRQHGSLAAGPSVRVIDAHALSGLRRCVSAPARRQQGSPQHRASERLDAHALSGVAARFRASAAPAALTPAPQHSSLAAQRSRRAFPRQRGASTARRSTERQRPPQALIASESRGRRRGSRLRRWCRGR
jgi:hypothetical protein